MIRQGQSADLTINFVEDGVAYDPYVIDWVRVYDPSDVLQDTLVPANPSVGVYTCSYNVAADADVGNWEFRWQWKAKQNAESVIQTETFGVAATLSSLGRRYFRRNLRQTAVYWSAPTPGADGKGYVYADPIEIRCRWQDKVGLFTDATGREIKAMATLWTAQDLEVEGYIMLGTLDDLDSVLEPPHVRNDTYRIRGSDFVTGQTSKQKKIRRYFLGALSYSA